MIERSVLSIFRKKLFGRDSWIYQINIMQTRETKYYKTFSDEMVRSKNQNYRISDDYIWIRREPGYQFLSEIVYAATAIAGFFYCRFKLHLKIKNRKILRKYRNCGYFIFGNHTQPVGDVFIPTQVDAKKRAFALADQANMGIPAIGKLLPLMGALPVPEDISGLKKLRGAVLERIAQKHSVIIYPEAHVWPYYTKIRPFPLTSFHFPIESNALSFCMTVTYRKGKYGKKPEATVYIDGPFVPDNTLKSKERQKKLWNEIYACMNERSRNNTYEYILYKEDMQ